jgi:tripartite-type tricarboxylate transporter receptor subunit TctC
MIAKNVSRFSERTISRTMLTRRVLMLAGMASPLAATTARADTYPARAIKMIAPFTPGSPVDVTARLLAQHLSIELKQSVIVDNRPGAGTTIGMKAAALAEPDGYTLLFQSSSFVVAPAMYKNLDYDPLKSFAPVANVVWGSWVTVVPPQLPVHNPQELIAYAKANPYILNFGYGQGTAPQLVGEWFNKTNGLAITDVPYKGGMQAIVDMLGGTIQINIGTTATLLPLIRSGKIRAIAQWGSTREAELPDVPTMIESGVPGLSLGFWAGLWAPAGTPDTIVAILNDAANRVLGSAEVRTAMARLGVRPSIGTPKDFAQFLSEEAPKWRRIVEASGVKVN